MISEEEVRVLYLPAYNQLFSHKPEIPFVKVFAIIFSYFSVIIIYFYFFSIIDVCRWMFFDENFYLLQFWFLFISFQATSSHVSGYPILFLLNAAGQVVVLSLPTLKSLLCCPLFKQSIELDDPWALINYILLFNI